MGKINNNKQKNNKKSLNKANYNLKSHSAQELYQFAVKAYQEVDQNAGDKWNKMMTESGTKKDKISAAGLMILQNPQSSLRYFDMLIKWCFDSNQNFAIKACESLTKVFVEHVFIQKNSLKIFADSVQQHIHNNKKNSSVDSAVLIGFYLQNQIKQYYNQLIKSFQLLLHCDLTHIKKTCLKLLGSLARFRQLRRSILSLIINKLGDTDLQVVNQVTKCLKQQFYEDILSGQTLLEETQRFLFRKHLPQKAQFYVINFLNSINLKFLNEKGMNRIFEIFYHFFKKFVDQNQASSSDDLASRLFLNSIKGLNKIFSQMKSGNKQARKNIQQKIEDIYRVIHKTPNLKAQIQLLLFLFQTHTHIHNTLIDRYYRTLYEFLSQRKIVHCSLAQMFFDLVLVSIKQDQNINRIMAMCKRLLQLCFHANSNFIITTLLMLDKIIQEKDGFQTLLFQTEDVMSEEGSIEKYDIYKREPKYANAQKTCLWQIKVLQNHYHPTIRKFTENILKKKPIEFDGANPLLEFSLTSFIQKFSLRKQKKSDSWKMKVRHNLRKIRTSKYQSILEKPLENFQQDQHFIKQYLQKRQIIHNNKNRMQGKDIQEYADQLIQQQMDRLNPQEDQLAEFSQSAPISGQDQQQFQQDEFQGQYQDNQQDDIEQGNQFGASQEEDISQDNDSMQGLSQEDFDQDQMDEQVEQDKQFEDVFDEIDDEDSYPANTKKTKKINKNSNNKKPNFKKNNKRLKGSNKRKK